MPLLALDSSTGPASAAIIGDDGALLALFVDSEPMRQSQFLVGNVDKLVRDTLGGYETLSAIAVTVGPGGFTGIRIAIAAARGLALAANLPVIGVTTLETFAWSALSQAETGAKAHCMVDAYRGQAYCQSFERNETGIHALNEYSAINFEEIDTKTDGFSVQNFTLTPDAPIPFPPPYAQFAGAYAAQLLRHESAANLAKSRPAEAVYIRPPDAKAQTPFLTQHGAKTV
ncbi:MAG: tRNA (adenosine(37)-N6)-threonylcarbamoyltransferase complex dimerization subunit type 1 TsaB [Alphaproteobacteria bacterium]|nr:tRNA (adenosine(37)-N6)-threonylcarbamoyltransferase complex dimerization subunit type 1 TsaB [Alphaproteobacteria bacterium]